MLASPIAKLAWAPAPAQLGYGSCRLLMDAKQRCVLQAAPVDTSGNTSGGGGRRGRERHCNSIAADGSEAVAAETTTPKQQQQQQQRRRRRVGQSRDDFAFFIARSDLAWRQPWRFEQTAPLADLQLRQQGVAALDDDALGGGSNVGGAAGIDDSRLATAAFRVQQPAGLGALLVNGTASAEVPLRCEFCAEPYLSSILQEFNAVVYLTGGAADEAAVAAASAAGSDLDADTLYFPNDTELCDITGLVTEALIAALPTVCLCGGGSCRQHAGREVAWRTTAPPDAPAPASPFAKLLQQKQQQKQQRSKKSK